MTAAVTYLLGHDRPIPGFILSNPAPFEQQDIRDIPGTLWERVAEHRGASRSPEVLCVCGHPRDRHASYSGFGDYLGDATGECGVAHDCRCRMFIQEDAAPRENIPQRVERIARDQHVSFDQAMHIALAESRLEAARGRVVFGLGHDAGRSAYETMRKVFAEQLELERAKAAHPAGKGIKRKEGNA